MSAAGASRALEQALAREQGAVERALVEDAGAGGPPTAGVAHRGQKSRTICASAFSSPSLTRALPATTT